MGYGEFKPSEQLKSYIDTYWLLQNDSLVRPSERRIFADGCMEIFINAGKTKPVINHVTELLPGKIYLAGTMTCSNIITSIPDSVFVGIRFKPAGFSAFYKVAAEELVDKIAEFPDQELLSIIDLDEGLVERLDRFFTGKIRTISFGLIPLTQTIVQSKGLITVDYLASVHNMTTRTMERSFKREIGISPKLFIGIIKFIHVSKRIKNNNGKDSLLRIAYEQGYYDHAHLTKEVKRYTGLNPSEIGLKNRHL
ncbi:AraC-like DNA-binding protein [Pedobacter sp. AK017]|uniref:helix-turn-helix domain-containing protein n=1 Tax=Pedobacter sp. AK017 TaxID=2723073 RepID=UPI00161A5904|nr:helix-turn-helix domain-containing protein [Pedobacter sp. AK017]MBB5441219.1 AraC-like DNA-binding protein [Pedobacter sp. AK017]